MLIDSAPFPAWLGLDLGTSSVKALLVDAEGRTLGRSRRPVPLETPSPLAAEQDPEDWWTAAADAIRACLSSCPGARVEAVGLTGQKHALLALGEDRAPLAPARLWADGRAREEAAWMARRVPRLLRRTGAPSLPGYVVPKWLQWSAEHPRLAAETRHLCLAKDYLRLRLTGALATDPTEASATQLYDGARRTWSAALCSAFGVPIEALPPITASAQVAGTISADGARSTGLEEGTPVVGGAGDNEAAAVACGALEEGVAAVVLGTSGTVVAPCGRRRTGPGLVSCRSALRRGYVATGVVLSAGRAFEWIRAAAFPPSFTVEAVIAEAIGVEAAPDLPFFLPSLVGERSPLPDADGSGVLAGLRPQHGRAHLAAAVLHGVAATLGEVVVEVRRAGVPVRELRLTSGGAASERLGALIAAAADAPAARVGEDEGPARGAALLACSAGGSDGAVIERARAWIRPHPVHRPDSEDVRRMAEVRDGLRRLRRLHG